MLCIVISMYEAPSVAFTGRIDDDVECLIASDTLHLLTAKDYSFAYIMDDDGKIIGVELYLPCDSSIRSHIQLSKDCYHLDKGSFVRIWFIRPPKHYCVEDPEFGDRYYYSEDLKRLIILLPVFCLKSPTFYFLVNKVEVVNTVC